MVARAVFAELGAGGEPVLEDGGVDLLDDLLDARLPRRCLLLAHRRDLARA
jgi:hypothetical protein